MKDCLHCMGGGSSERCIKSNHCYDCYDCTECKDCTDCKDCTKCDDCNKCESSTSLEGCKLCFGCESCTRSIHLQVTKHVTGEWDSYYDEDHLCEHGYRMCPKCDYL